MYAMFIKCICVYACTFVYICVYASHYVYIKLNLLTGAQCK